MKYLKEEEVRNISSPEQLDEVVNFYEKNDRWIEVAANSLRTFGVSNLPLLLLFDEKQNEIKDTCSEDNFNECVAETGLFLSIPVVDHFETYATRYTAFPSIYNRSGTNCRMVTTLYNKGFVTAKSAEERGEDVNRGWQTTKEPVKVLISDEKVSFVGSHKYVILPYREGIDTALQVLMEEFEEVSFRSGMISHEFILADWNIWNDEAECFRIFLEDHNVIQRDEKIKIIFRFTSGNVGNSTMTGRLLLQIHNVAIPIGPAKSIWHLSTKSTKNEKLSENNGCSFQDFREKLENIGEVLKDNEDLIEQMGNTTIMFPQICLEKAFGLCPSIPANVKKDVLESFYYQTCTAMDVYLAVSETMEKLTGKNLNAIVQIMEEVARLQKVDFTELDKAED